MGNEMMMLALAGLALNVLVTLGGIAMVLWRGGTMVGEMKATLSEIRGVLETLRKHDIELPRHELRIGSLEKATEHLSGRMVDVWQKVFSHDKHIAVARASQGHFDNSDD